DAAATQGMDRWRVVVVVAHQLYADLQLLEGRIVERRDVEVPVFPGDEHVARAVVRPGGEYPLRPGGDAHHHVTRVGRQGIANEASALGPPRVADGGMELR